jgi:hypothetical protein
MNLWALTGVNLLRATWRDSLANSASTEAVGWPKENSVDGNKSSEWRASASPGWLILDASEASPGYEYIALTFDYSKLPTSVKIETSDAVGSGYASIANNYDGSVSTTLSAAATRSSRLVSVTSSANIQPGNIVRINDGVQTTRKYLVISKGVGYLELDRYPEPYTNGATVALYPHTNVLAHVAGGESKRYIRITVTATTPHIMEAQAFATLYVFDGTGLPLNPFPVTENRRVGSVSRGFNNRGIGTQKTGGNYSVYSIGIGSMGEDARQILRYIERQERFGILMDNGQWEEVMLSGNMNINRRPSSDAELLTYTAQLTVEEV